MYKELLRNQVTDTQFQIECLSDELVEIHFKMDYEYIYYCDKCTKNY